MLLYTLISVVFVGHTKNVKKSQTEPDYSGVERAKEQRQQEDCPLVETGLENDRPVEQEEVTGQVPEIEAEVDS